MRLLFGRIGRTYSPVSGVQVKKHTIEDVIATAQSYPEGTRIAVTAPVSLPDRRSLKEQLEIYLKEGYSRVVKDGEFILIEDLIASPTIPLYADGYDLLVDRLAVESSGDEASRLADSIETAFLKVTTR